MQDEEWKICETTLEWSKIALWLVYLWKKKAQSVNTVCTILHVMADVLMSPDKKLVDGCRSRGYHHLEQCTLFYCVDHMLGPTTSSRRRRVVCGVSSRDRRAEDNYLGISQTTPVRLVCRWCQYDTGEKIADETPEYWEVNHVRSWHIRTTRWNLVEDYIRSLISNVYHMKELWGVERNSTRLWGLNEKKEADSMTDLSGLYKGWVRCSQELSTSCNIEVPIFDIQDNGRGSEIGSVDIVPSSCAIVRSRKILKE